MMADRIERGTRERILEVAETCFGELGYEGTRLHGIAARVGIQKASLFHYFQSKADLYRAVLEKGFGETEETLLRMLRREDRPLEKVREMVEAYVALVAAHRNRTRIFLRQSLGEAPNGHSPIAEGQRLLDLVVRHIEEGQRRGHFAPIDAVAAVLGIVGMVAFLMTSAPIVGLSWAAGGGPEGVDTVKRFVGEVAVRVLRPRACACGAEPAK